MITRLREEWPYLLKFTALLALVYGLGGLWMGSGSLRGLVVGAILGAVLGLANVLVIGPLFQRSRQSYEEDQAVHEEVRQRSAAERAARAEEAARSYEQQHGRRPW